MAELVLLGTASALPSAGQENTYMALVGESHTALIDCAGSPYRRLLQAGINTDSLDTLVLTHGHPDHLYGMPSLLMSLWLAGRRVPIDVYGPADTCATAQTIMALYHPEAWPGMFTVRYHPVPLQPDVPLFENSDFTVTATPVRHLLPTIGLRIVNRASGRVLAYSADTEPDPAVYRLAKGADILLHEASGGGVGHSSAEQAGSVAQASGVGRLILVHYSAERTPPAMLVEQAGHAYSGNIQVGQDFTRLIW